MNRDRLLLPNLSTFQPIPPKVLEKQKVRQKKTEDISDIIAEKEEIENKGKELKWGKEKTRKKVIEVIVNEMFADLFEKYK